MLNPQLRCKNQAERCVLAVNRRRRSFACLLFLSLRFIVGPWYLWSGSQSSGSSAAIWFAERRENIY